VSNLLLLVLVVSQLTFLEFILPTQIAEAAVVTIDSTATLDTNSGQVSGSQTVFISDQVGYNFYRDSTGSCVYSKTTNGGTSWGAAVIVDAQTDCISISVWYDQWTQGDFGTNIHIVTIDTSVDHAWYNRLDTSSDTRLLGTTPVDVASNSGQTGTLVSGENFAAISKDKNGFVFIAVSDATDSYAVRCNTNCNLNASWTETTGLFSDLGPDYNLLMPLTNGNMLIINRDVSADDMRSKVWNGSSWSGSWDTFDFNAVESATYEISMDATINHNTGEVYLVYGTDHNNDTVADHDIRSAKFASGSWTAGAAIFTDRVGIGLNSVAIALDVNTEIIYAAYTIRTTINNVNSTNIFYATSTAALSGWSTERGPIKGANVDMRGPSLNVMSDERLYVTWYEPVLDDVLGETLADIAPATKLYQSGTPITSVSAGTNNVYLGGKLALRESVASRSVTDIVISERGTVDASTQLTNIKLLYDLDTTAPYDCVSESYSGSETQFGSTDSNGFSGADGTSAFSGLVTISPTQAMCPYVVVDVQSFALDGETISVSVESPNADVLVTGGGITMPTGPVRFVGSSLIQNDELTQTHYQWRNDNGNETAATSATAGIQDTPIPALLQNTPRRLRIQVSNEGTQTSATTAFRLEFAEAAPNCTDATSWTDVGATNDAWNMFNSSFITDGANTTNIAVGNGGVTDENTTFLVANGGVRDTSSQTGGLTLTNLNFVELEFAITASTSAIEGATYCFRVTDAGTPLPVYSQYPAVTIAADVSVTSRGTQTTSVVIPATDQYLGGSFVLRENTSNRTVTAVTVSENGSVDAQNNLKNIRLRYDVDSSAPYDCASETYAGTEPQFGATDADGFSAGDGTSTFTGSLAITTTASICFYVVADVTTGAQNNDTIQIEIGSPTNDVVVSSGSVSPSTPILLTGTTTLSGPVVTQTGYHWRNDNGTETGATSATAGVQNISVLEHPQNTPIRLRLGISNEGAASTIAQSYQLQFGPKITTCSAVGVWSSVSTPGNDWDLFNSSQLTDGANTTNIGVASGGVADGNTTFVTPNGGVRDTTASSSAFILTNTQFTELEFSLTSTNITAFNTTYCFRVVVDGLPLPVYDIYAEIVTAPKRDFKVQRGTTVIAGITATLTAGVDYVAPSSTSTAFVRITDAHHTAPGRTTAGGGAQNADDITTYIATSTQLTTNFTIARPPTATGNTRVNWEIVEFIGQADTDNEMKVRGGGSVNLGVGVLQATGTALSSVSDDSDIVVFITGIENRDIARNFYYAGQVSAHWDAATNRPVFTRGASNVIVNVSYSVVEYTGINWRVQRVEHTYASSTLTETESIEPVNSLSRTFIHTQKRMGALANVNNYGHEVWLSSIGAVSFRLEPAATTPSGHTSVAWVIENQQTSAGAMEVNRYSGILSAGTEPVTYPISVFYPVESTNNASLFTTSRVVGANTTFPLVFLGARISSTSTVEFWRSESSGDLTYRTETVEWPVSGLAVRQNYYRFYVDNNALTPSDPWPLGVADLGENSPITSLDEPLGDGDRVRLRMSMRVANANLPAGLFDFKLQYGLRVTSCTGIGTWTDVGGDGSSNIWRGYNATGTTNGASLSASNPPDSGTTLISVSDRAGSLVEENPSPANPYQVEAGEDVEYDWLLEHNGAIERSVYCFRMIKSDGSALDGYFNYPQIRTAGYSPATKNWRFYTDAQNETPLSPASAEVVSPIEIQNNSVIAMRVTVGERKNVTGQNVKFKVQFDEDPTFTNPRDVVATSTCTASSTWCYALGGGIDNATITTKLLSDADTCASSVGNGCGTHNTSPTFVTGLIHPGSANREFSFYLRHTAARAGAVYYFRLYEVFENVPVPLAPTEIHPSLVAETAKLALTVNGLPAGTSTAGILTTATTTPTGVTFGSLPLGVSAYAAHRLAVTTNATEGYRVFMYARQQLQNAYGTTIAPITSTNAVPAGWNTACPPLASGCAGYHSTDATLGGGSTRFAPLDSYAALHSNPLEVMFSPLPTTEVHDIVYRVLVRPTQPAGDYESEVVYIAVPTY
jgi:hypothetical protein